MRLDGQGRRRFTYRGIGKIKGGTRSSWQEASAARERLEKEAALLASEGDVSLLSGSALRQLSLSAYVKQFYWPWALETLEDTTLLDYAQYLPILLDAAGHYTLEQLDEAPLLMDAIKSRIRKAMVYPPGHKRAGSMPKAAPNHVLKTGSSALGHAHKRSIIRRNPFKGIDRFAAPRTRGTEAPTGTHHAVEKER